MSQFKVGDIVRCVDVTFAMGDLVIGRQYAVSATDEFYVEVESVNGVHIGRYMNQRFTLVSRFGKEAPKTIGLQPQVLKTELLVFCDVDDTLVMHKAPGSIDDTVVYVQDPLDSQATIKLYVNQPIIRLLKEKKQRGYTVVVWSLGGYQWAHNAVIALGLEDIVDMVMSKPLAYVDDKPVESWLTHRIYLDPATKYKT